MRHVTEMNPGHLECWTEFETSVRTFTAPEETEQGIEPAVAVVTKPTHPADLGMSTVRVPWEPTSNDVELLGEGGTLWLSTWGGLPPHMLEVQAPGSFRRRFLNRIYVASSWRNEVQPWIVKKLRESGFEVYDFRNPAEGDQGFHWGEVGMPSYDRSTNSEVPVNEYLEGIEHPRAIEGFDKDFDAMKWADVFVLVLPCGRSAHLELGWAVGAGKTTAILLEEGVTIPELMYRMVDYIAPDPGALHDWLRSSVYGSPQQWTDATRTTID